MAVTWRTLTEHLNNQTYMVYKPTYYARVQHIDPIVKLPASHHNNDITLSRSGAKVGETIITSMEYRPVFEPDIDEFSLSRITISDMIDMYSNKIQFTITEDNEVLQIVNILDQYVEWISVTSFSDTEFTLFNNKLKSFYLSMKTVQSRICALKRIPVPNSGHPLENVFRKLMAGQS